MPQTDIRRRSRSGCQACRRQHRKCDEQRPACSACRMRGAECDYQRPLKWTGLRSSDTFNQQNQQNPIALDTSADPPPAINSVVPLQLEFGVSEWLAHTAEESPDGDTEIEPLSSSTYHQTTPAAFYQNECGTVQDTQSTTELPRSQAEDTLWDDIGHSNDDGFIVQSLPKPRERSNTAIPSSSLSDSDIGVIENVMGNLFTQILPCSSDEMAFTYYLRRVCPCTAAYDGDQNPYRNLALMALSYPVLLHGILSVSTAHMEMFGKTSRCTLYSRQSQALRSLRAALKSLHLQDDGGFIAESESSINLDGIFSFHSSREITLAAMIMQTFSVLMVDLSGIETHVTYALYLITHLDYLTQPPRPVFLRTLIYRFAMVDVMLAFVQSRYPQAPADFFMYQSTVDQILGQEEPSFREMHGCHPKVLSFLAQIAILSFDFAKPGSVLSEIQAKGYDLETEMRIWGRTYYGGVASESNPLIGEPDEQRFNSQADLEIVCECFYWVAPILLLRRVFSDDTRSTRVQLIRKHLFRLMDSLVSGCGPDSSLPFPFYIAACEATTTSDRTWVRKKHAEMLAAYRDPAREALMSSVQKIWDKSESEVPATVV